jgi:hypothetical protein
MKKLLSLFLIFTGVTVAQAQLSLAPTAVYLDKNGIGNLFITNNTNSSQEITVSFQFGYSDQDENGVLIMRYGDTAKARIAGLDQYIKAFPRTFILPPKQQQIVRLQARMPKNLPVGTFFTRIKVGSSGQVADVGTAQNDGGVATQINLRFEQIIVVFYKNGAVTAGLAVDKMTHGYTNNQLSLDLHYRCTTTSPFLGKAQITLKGPDGKVAYSGTQTVALYFNSKRRFNISFAEKLPSGRYDVEFKFETSRNDIPAEDLVQGPPYTYRSSFVIQ